MFVIFKNTVKTQTHVGQKSAALLLFQNDVRETGGREPSLQLVVHAKLQYEMASLYLCAAVFTRSRWRRSLSVQSVASEHAACGNQHL